ncbi:MAG: hypothetical protein VW891_17300, partial [Novosphingobium sp.]
LTTHFDYPTYWGWVNKWEKDRGLSTNGDNGYGKCGACLLGRLSRWLLTGRSMEVNFFATCKRQRVDGDLAEVADAAADDAAVDAAPPAPPAHAVPAAPVAPAAPATPAPAPVNHHNHPPPSQQPPQPTEEVNDADADEDDIFDQRLRAEIEKMEHMSTKEYEAENSLAMQVRSAMAAEKNQLAQVDIIWLGNIPQLANIDRSMTTNAVWKFLDAAFETMTEREYNQFNFRGIEYYYEPHPTKGGYRCIGKQYDSRAAHIDHVLAQCFSPFDHPRFYVLMPAQINKALSNRPPAARLAYGLTRSTIRIISVWISKLRKKLKTRNFDDVYAELPRVQ